MLFKKKEQFFLNLVVDYENINENIEAGFCGFMFFINGEWKVVTIDTTLPWHQQEDMTVSSAHNTQKLCFWLSLFEKAYAKVFKSYDTLNNLSIKNTLVDFTGGVSKKIIIKDKMDDQEKKNMFEEMKRWISQGYLMGCMKYVEKQDDLDASTSQDGDEEEVLTNSMYVILDIQEVSRRSLMFRLMVTN